MKPPSSAAGEGESARAVGKEVGASPGVRP